jgi:23S rRNA A2030 N6-methylase RlmJ
VDWKLLDDPANIENANAGNGGDLVKHTVYLATIRYLLTQEPWAKGLFVRECHAGRGIYRIPKGDPRVRLISAVFSDSIASSPILLQAAPKSILNALGCWDSESVEWYAGSALMNAGSLFGGHGHSLELYEYLPETGRILYSVLNDVQPAANRCWRMPSAEEDEEFDGETYIEQHIGNWGKQNLVLLDNPKTSGNETGTVRSSRACSAADLMPAR